MLDRCVRLVHATASRRRYRIESATPVDWGRLDAELQRLRAREGLTIRCNRSCSSVVFSLSDPAMPQVLQEAWTALCEAVEVAGATPPEPEILRVRVQVVRPSPLAWIRQLSGPFNMASLGVSLALLLLSFLVALLGILGMMLPMAPGAPLLLLAFVLLEAAFALRRPFVRPVATV